MSQSYLARPADEPALELTWPHELRVIVSALRAFVRAESPAEVATALQETISHLGGEVVAATSAEESDLRVDVSLGVGEPLVVRPPDDAVAALFLTSQIGSIVDDALAAVRQSDRHERETVHATTDALTKVSSHTEIGARLGLSGPGDVVCVLNLDNFKLLNDLHGHAAGDAALRQLGSLLLDSTRQDDFVGRSGGDEFVVVFQGIPWDTANARMRLLASKWRISGGHNTSVSVGIAAVSHHGGAWGAKAAGRAMHRAKRAGRGLVELAVMDDYTDVDE